MKEQIVAMFNKTCDFIKLLFRRLRLIKVNRNSLVFLVFLFISMVFWCMQTLKDINTITNDYSLKIVGLPKDVIFTSDIPENIRVNISGRGFDFINYIIKSNKHVVVINYDDLEHSSNKISIDNTMLKRCITKEIGGGLKVSSITPSQLDIYYTKGKPKRVPIEFLGKVKANKQHVLCGIEIQTKSAEVYAPLNMHDSIKCVYTEPLIMENLEDTTIVRVAIRKINGAKVIPDSIDVKICVDLFTEKTLSVPIYSKNIPHNKVLRTFPPRANVTFRVSATMFNEINEEDFVLAVDFNSIKKSDKECKVTLEQVPAEATHVRIDPEYVEFIIEQEDN